MRSKKKGTSKINKELIAISIVAISLFTVIIISVKGNNFIKVDFINDIINPIQIGINAVYNGSVENIGGIFKYKSNLKKIEDLSKENQELKKKIIEIDLSKDELSELRSLKKGLNYITEDYSNKYITASVVSKNDGNWYDTFTISAGKKDGVVKDSIVVSGEGIIGKVYDVSENYSKVISILNNKSSISFEVLRKSEYTGILSQNLSIDYTENFDGYLKGYLFDMKYKVVPGDILITSGIGIYPKGLPIGEVEKIIDDKSNLLKYIKVKPYSDLNNIDKVMVLFPRVLE